MNIYRWDPSEKDPEDGRRGGVYLIMDEHGDPLYIGACRNWTIRRYGHYRREYWPLAREIVMLRWMDVEERWSDQFKELEASEAYLIALLKPPYNRRHVTPDSFRQATLKGWENRRAKVEAAWARADRRA